MVEEMAVDAVAVDMVEETVVTLEGVTMEVEAVVEVVVLQAQVMVPPEGVMWDLAAILVEVQEKAVTTEVDQKEEEVVESLEEVVVDLDLFYKRPSMFAVASTRACKCRFV